MTPQNQDETGGPMTNGTQQWAAPPHDRMPLVVISILNWNGWQDTLECLKSVRKLDYPNYLTVVVDNGSWNDSADRIRTWAQENLGPGHVLADYTRQTALAGGDTETEKALDRAPSSARLVLIRNEENLGFAGGNNVSIRYGLARSTALEFAFLLNNDARAHPASLTRLVSATLQSGAGIASALVSDEAGLHPELPGASSPRDFVFKVVCGRMRGLIRPRAVEEPDGLPRADAANPPRDPRPETSQNFRETPFAHGAGMLLTAGFLRDVFQKRRDYLNTAYFLYHEEMELSFQARSLGTKVVLVPGAQLLHRSARSSSTELQLYYKHRNIIRLSQVVLSLRSGVAFNAINFFVLPLRLLKLAVSGQTDFAMAIFRGQLDGYLGRMGKWKRHDEVMLAWRRRNATRNQPTPRLAEEAHTR